MKMKTEVKIHCCCCYHARENKYCKLNVKLLLCITTADTDNPVNIEQPEVDPQLLLLLPARENMNAKKTIGTTIF